MSQRLRVPALWVLFLLTMFPQLGETIYSPALPEISHHFLSTNAMAQWTLSAYFSGFTMGVFFWGWLSDHIGRRHPMLISLFIYLAASILCLHATSINQLLLFRVIQGLGASCGSVLVQAIVREALSVSKRRFFYSSAGFLLAASTTMGPLLGGYLTEFISWHANFYFLAFMGLFLFLLALFLLPETHLNNASFESKSMWPVFKRMITDKHILASTWIIGVINGILFGYYAEGPFIFIRMIKLTPSEFGQLGLFIAIASLMGTLISTRLIKKYSPKKIVNIGSMLLIITALIFVLVIYFIPVSIHHKVLSIIIVILPVMGLIFASFGFLLPIILSEALLAYKQCLGRAGALFGSGYYLLISVFTWIMGAIHNGQVWPMPVYFLLLSISAVIAVLWLQFVDLSS